MKKGILPLLFFCLGIGMAQSQLLSNYVVSTDYQPWVSIAPTATLLNHVVSDGGTQTITMPFTFLFGEGTITQGTTIYLRADGYMVLINNPGSHNAYSYYNGGAPVIVPFLLVDGQMPSGNSACYWQLETDSDGGQVLAVEFQHVQHWQGNNDNFNYQLRLYENGNVSVHYGHMENHYNDSSFNFMMSSGAVTGDHVVLSGTWDSPSPVAPSSIGSSASTVSHLLTGMPDSGLVITYERPGPACDKPRNIHVDNLEPTSGGLAWRGNGVPGCTYEFYIDTTWFSYLYPGSRPLLSTNDTVYWLDSLQPNHHYYVYIMSDCGSDVSMWQSYEFMTPCQSMSRSDLPFAENFDSYTDYTTYSNIFDPGCWRRSTTGAAVNVRSGQRCLRMSSGVVALPPIDNLAGLEVTFNAYCQDGTMEMGILENPGDYESFLPLHTVTAPTNVWSNLSLRTGGYSGTGKSIAFRVNGVWHVDNINVHESVGCPAVDTVSVDSVDATTARVSWIDNNHTGSYRVVYRPLASSSSDTLNVASSPVTLTGLLPDEEYMVMVYALCGDEASAPFSAGFHTLCTAMTAPFSEGFERGALSSCWTVRGMRFLSSNHVSGWLPEVSQSEATAGTHSLRLVSKRTNIAGREASWVVLPSTTDSSNRLTVDFDYKVPNGYEHVELAVGVTTSETDTSGFVRVATFRPVDGNWHRYSVNLVSCGVASGRIALLQDNHSDHSYTSTLPYDYGYLDSVAVSPFTDCMRPVSVRVAMLSDVEATVSWVDVNSPGTYEVTCGTQTLMVSGDTSCTFTGLTPQTTYTVSVRQLCIGGFTDACTATFTTDCAGIASLPWSENFVGWSDIGFNSCWTFYLGPDSYSDIEIFDAMGIHSLRMKASIFQGDTISSIAVLPPLAMPYDGITVSMNVMGLNTDTTNSVLELGVLTNGSDRNTFVAFDTIPFTAGSFGTWSYYEHALTGLGAGRLALRFNSLNSWHQVFIDDISLFYTTSCPRPGSLLLDSAGLSSLSVRIVDADSAGRYRLWWSDGLQADSADATGYTYTINGLSHSTTYDLAVASICPSDSTLSTVLTATMSTACGMITHGDLPWTATFDNGIGLCSRVLDFYSGNSSGNHTTDSHYRGNTGRSLNSYADEESPFFFVLPEVDSVGGMALDFWSKELLFVHATLTVGVMSNPTDTSTFTPLATMSSTDVDSWEEHYVSLGSYADSGRYVAIRIGSDIDFSTIVFLDDVSLVHDLSCIAPDSVTVAALTDTTATLVVHDPRGVGHYRLYNGSDTVDFHSDTLLVTGLAPATDYTLSVSSVCVEGFATFPVQVSFVTECGIYALPYLEDFDRQPLYAMPRCWTLLKTTTYDPSVRSTTYSDGRCFTGNLYSEDSVLTVATPPIRFVDTDIYISFRVRVDQYFTDSIYHTYRLPLRMQVAYIGDSVYNNLVLYDDTLASYGSSYVWESVGINTLSIPQGVGTLLFSVFRDSLATYATFALDSVSVISFHHDPPCRRVETPRVVATNLSSATIEWTPRGVESEWEVHLFNTFTDTVVTVDTTVAVLPQLIQATLYQASVRPLCSDGAVLWSDTVTFTTWECPAVDSVSVVVVSAHAATATWHAPTEGPWLVEYGTTGFREGGGIQVQVDSSYCHDGWVTCHIGPLESATVYDFYVKTLCEDGWTSVWSDVVTFTTGTDGIADLLEPVQGVRLYPNPFDRYVTVEYNGAVPLVGAILTDLTGRQEEVPIQPLADGKFMVDLGHCRQAACLLTLVTATGQRYTERLLKSQMAQ